MLRCTGHGRDGSDSARRLSAGSLIRGRCSSVSGPISVRSDRGSHGPEADMFRRARSLAWLATESVRYFFGMTLIDTPRLRLRPRVPKDVESTVIMDSDPEVRRFMGGPLDPKIHGEAVLANIMRVPAKHWSWAIERNDRAGFLGMCLLRPLDGTEFICMGWRLMHEHWGQGIATEATRAVLDQALHALAIDPVVAIVDPRNLASIRVAEKIGMRQAGRRYDFGTEQLFFRADAATDLR
jgi:RimJ/RimL family protein N-acetyltransferase